jgi:hypothetical protein
VVLLAVTVVVVVPLLWLILVLVNNKWKINLPQVVTQSWQATERSFSILLGIVQPFLFLIF